MGKVERAAALTKRRRAVAVINNIRRTRRVLSSNPFDAKTFNALNGVDGGIEQLVGRSIFFEGLTENEVLQLRRDIVSKMNVAENEAFEVLRSSTREYFSDIQEVIDRLDNVKITQKNITDLSFKEASAIEAFKSVEIPQGALDYERCMSTLEHLDVVAESVDTTTPEIEHELEEPEYTEEQHVHEDDVEPLPEADAVPAEDPAEPVTLPEDPSEVVPDGDVNTDDPEQQNEVADLSWIKGEESFFASANLFFLKDKATTADAGFTPENAGAVLGKYASSLESYRRALIKVRDTIAPETCVADNLLRGSTNFYQRFDRLVCLVENLETLRDGLNKSCECLVEASKQMLIKATRDAML